MCFVIVHSTPGVSLVVGDKSQVTLTRELQILRQLSYSKPTAIARREYASTDAKMHPDGGAGDGDPMP